MTAVRHPAPRTGATAVEFALVCSVFFLFLFGVFEYCRYLVLIQACTNAARDAARFAAVNVNNLTTSPASQDFRGTVISDPGYPPLGVAGYPANRPVFTVPAIKAYLIGDYDNGLPGADNLKLPQGRLGGIQRMLTPVTPGAEIIQVYPCDPTTLYTAPPSFDPRVQVVGSNGVTALAWNRAQFTERIAVRITGTYTPTLPSFLRMDQLRRVNIIAVMGSEG